MMGHLGINMRVTCGKDEILAKLKANREQHSKLVAEAQEGYLAKAQSELEKKLGALREGKIVGLAFSLKVPKDFSTVYDTTIHMLEAHTGTTIELSADEFRHLVDDEWDWTRDFINANASYSSATRNWSVSKGLDLE